jgi:hypothetical protein
MKSKGIIRVLLCPVLGLGAAFRLARWTQSAFWYPMEKAFSGSRSRSKIRRGWLRRSSKCCEIFLMSRPPFFSMEGR